MVIPVPRAGEGLGPAYFYRRGYCRDPVPAPSDPGPARALPCGAWRHDALAGPATTRRSPSSGPPPTGARRPRTRRTPSTRALEAGVNHLDVAPQYGRAQELVGPLIPAVRDRLFVGCKTLRNNRRRRPGAARGVARARSAATHFDLYQLHAVTDLDELDRPGSGGRGGDPGRAATKASAASSGSPDTGSTAPAAHLEALRALRPRHRHVPGEPAPVGATPTTGGTPRRCSSRRRRATSA